MQRVVRYEGIVIVHNLTEQIHALPDRQRAIDSLYFRVAARIQKTAGKFDYCRKRGTRHFSNCYRVSPDELLGIEFAILFTKLSQCLSLINNLIARKPSRSGLKAAPILFF